MYEVTHMQQQICGLGNKEYDTRLWKREEEKNRTDTTIAHQCRLIQN